MGAHLYAVPDGHDGGPELQAAIPSLYLPRPAHHGGPGEYPLAPPTPAPADGEQPQEHPLDDGQDEEQILADEAGEQPLDEDEDQGDAADEDEQQWEPARRALTFPDLRPYADVPEAARLLVGGTLAVGRLTVEHAPAGGRLLWRATTATGRALRTAMFATGRALRAATAAVAAVVGPPWRALTGWCHGGEGATGPYKRAGIVAAALFAGGNALQVPGIVRVGIPAVWFLGFLLTGRSPDEAPAKGKGKAPKGKGKSPAPVSKESGPPPAAAPEETPVEPVEETPVGDVEESPVEGAEDVEQDPAGPPAETPAPAPAGPPPLPSPEALAEALHHLYRGGSGVLHTALRDHLRQPHTRAIRAALDVAGIPSRPGVRAGVGAGAPNGPGVHHRSFPPLPLSQGDPQGNSVGAGQSATNTNTTSGEGSEKGFRVDTTDSGFTVYDLSATTHLTPGQ